MRFTAGAHRFRGRILTAAIAWVVLFAALALPMSPADAVPDETIADDFQSYSFTGSTGGVAWQGPWFEVGESDGVDAGTIQVRDEPNCLNEPCLVVGRSSGPDAWVDRQVDLSGYASANLTFDYKVHWHAPGGGTGELSVSDDGGDSWSTLDSWPLGTTTGDLVGSYDLTPYLAANTVIRFGATGSSSESHINIDNLVITASGRQGYFDEFADLAWDGSDGSLDWTPSLWQTSGGTGPTSGLIQAISNSFCASGNCLRIEGSATNPSHYVARQVDLSGATFASLLFNYRRENYNTCSIRLEVSDNGGSSWNHVTTYTNNGGDASQQSAAHDITGFTAPDTQIRFISDGTCTPGEFFFADNIWVYTDATPDTEVCYLTGTNGGIHQITSLDLSDPDPLSAEVTIGVTGTDIRSIALDPTSGSLLAATTDELYTVNKVTGAVSAIGPFGSSGPTVFNQISGLAFDPTTGVLYASHYRDGQEDLIFQVNPTTGAFVPDAFGPGVDYVNFISDKSTQDSLLGIAVDAAGQMWGMGWDGNSQEKLHTIDKFTGAAVDDLGSQTVGDLSFDSAGTLWGVDPAGELFEIRSSGSLRDVDNLTTYSGLACELPVAANLSPIFDQDLLDRIDTAGDFITIGAPATDPDAGDTLNYSATGLPDGITINSGTGAISGVLGPNSEGTHAITVTVADNGTPALGDTDTFTWTVDPGDVFYLLASLGGGAGGDDLLTGFDPTDFDDATNEVDIGSGLGTSTAEGAAIHPGTGQLYIANGDRIGVADAASGTYSPRPSTVGIGGGPHGTITFSSVVALAFQPSTDHLYAVAQRGSQEDLLVRVDPDIGVHVPGAFGGDDYVPIEGLPSSSIWNQGLAFDPTTGLLYSVSANLLSSTLVTIDPATGATTAVGSTAHPTYGLSFDESGQLWGVKSLFGTEEVVEINKTTGAAGNPRPVDNGSIYRAIAISGEPVPNLPPVFDQDLGDRTDPEGALISIVSPATDPNFGDNLTYSATGLPDGVSIDSSSGTISGALSASSSGVHAVVVVVTDSGSPAETDTDTFTWSVTPGEPTYLIANEGGGAGGDDILTAVDRTDSDPATNEIDIGVGTGTFNIEAAAMQPGTNLLFAVEDDQIGAVDVETGIFTPLPSPAGTGFGSVGLVTFDNIEGLSFNPYTGELFATHRRMSFEEDLLIRIDPTSGAHVPGAFGGDDYTPIQQQGVYYHSAAIAHDPTDGQLYVIHWNLAGSWSLATVHSEIGATTTLGAMPNDVVGLAFDGSGRLYASTASGAVERLHEIDKATGSSISSFVIDNGQNYEAIAIAYPAEPNQGPTFAQDLTDRTDSEGTVVSLSATATDPEAHDLNYTATGLPGGLTIDTGTGLISGTIDFAASAASPYNTVITVTDDGIPNLAANLTFTWTVTESNRVPVFDQDLLDRSDAEGTVISLSAVATDPDGDDGVTYGVSGLPPGLVLNVFSGEISGTIGYTAADGSPYAVTITATDDRIPPGVATPDTFTWSVTNTNQPPEIVNPGPQTTPELTPFSLVVTATDPDGTMPSLTDSGTLPAWATLTDNLDGTATIAGIPGIGDSGTITVTVTASDGSLTSDAVFDITVTNTNVAPAITNPGNQTGSEGSPFTVTVTASDPDGTTVSFADSGTLPAWATLTDNGDDTATVTGTPGYDDAGTATVTITASDGLLTDDAVFDIIISNTNRSPVVTPIADQITAENVALTPIVISASDPDGTPPSLSAPSLPGWASFVDNGDGTGTITGTPGYDDDGTTNVTVFAFDGSLMGTASFDLTVTNTNRAPVLGAIGDQTVAEGSALPAVTATATDPDGTVVSLAASGLPGWASFVDNGDGTGTITGTPDFADAAVSTVTIYAEDGGTPNLSDTITFDITVTNINRAPLLDPVGDQTVAEGSALTPVVVNATDPDGTPATLTASGLPGWASFVDNGDGTGAITGTPGYDDAGVSTVTIYAEDGGVPNLSDTVTFDIDVTDTNRPPVLSPVADQTVIEGTGMIPVAITAADPDGTTPALSATGLPGWAAFVDNGDGTGLITGTPGFADAGISTIIVTATDGSLFDTKAFDITVTQGNRPPVFDSELPDRTDAEGTAVAIGSGATDPDGDTLIYSAAGLPPGVVIDPATGQITGTLPYAAAGTYGVTINALDDGTPALLATAQFTWTVTNTNRAPVLTPIAAILGPEQTELNFTATASDPDGQAVTYSIAGAPAGATIDPVTGVFTWTPSEAQGEGSYAFTVVAADNGVPSLSDTKTITITVTEVNLPPVLDPIGDQHNDVEDLVELHVIAADPDVPLNSFTFAASGLPAGLSIQATSGRIFGSIAAGAPGTHDVTVTVTDDGNPQQSASMSFKWLVGDTNHPPEMDRISDRTVAELSPITIRPVATDPDGDRIRYELAGAPPGSSFDAATGTFHWTPSEEQGPGTYRLSIIAADNGDPELVTIGVFAITVTEVNSPPTIEGIPDRADDAGSDIFMQVLGADTDLPANSLTFTATDLPPGLSIDPATGAITGQIAPTTDEVTHYETAVTVSDDGDEALSASTEFTWTVVGVEALPENFPPSVDPIAAQYSDAGAAVGFGVQASDTEPLAFSASGLPGGLTIDPTTGMISGTVALDAIGTHAVVVTVVDSGDVPLRTSISFTWTVTNREAADQKDDVVVTITDTGPNPDDEGTAGSVAGDSRPIRRGLVVMSSAAVATTESMRLPMALLLALLVGFATIGRVGLYPLLWRGERHDGTLGLYDPELDFGLIHPDDGGEQVFVHANAFPRRQRATLATGMRIRYRVLAGDNRASAWGATTEVSDE